MVCPNDAAAFFAAIPDAAIVIDEGRVVAMNPAFRALLARAGTEVLELDALPLAGVLVENLEWFVERMPLAHASGEVVRIHLRTSTRPIPVDVRVGRTDGGAWVLVGRDATVDERIGAVAGDLSSLYATGGSAFEDAAAVVDHCRSVLDALGWNVGIWRVGPEALVLETFWMTERARQHPSGLAPAMLPRLQKLSIPRGVAVHMERTVTERRGQSLEEFPSVLGRLAAGTDLELPANLDRDAFVGSGLVRGATAPVFTSGRVSHVVSVVGAAWQERDSAGVQLFASMLSAVLRMNALGADMARQQRHAALGQMSRQLAHEVRNPLAVILQASRQARKGDAEARIQMLDIIDEESERLRRLMEDLVSFAGPIEPRLESTPLAPIVRWSHEALRPVERREMEIAIPDSLMVRADPVLLRQALTHLLSNACGHARDHARVAASSDGERVHLRIENDGEPMTGEVARRVFEPFFSTRPTGTGLGLAVVRRLIEDQGGEVELDVGGDAIAFVVSLPAG